MMRRILSIPEMGIAVMLVTLVVVFQSLNPLFLSPLNIAGILRATAFAGIVSIGLALCLISGTIDISVGAIAGLSSIIFSKCMVSGINVWVSAGIAILAGLAAGGLNAFTIVKLKITPFIATISTMYIFRGLCNYISGGYTVYPLPAAVPSFGSAQPLGLSWPFITMVICMVIAGFFLNRTVWGLCVRATGSDKESAECTEVNVNFIQSSVIIIAGGLAAIAGVMVTTVLGAGQPYVGQGWELTAIAACAIGGVSLFGYQGSMIGLFMGLVTLQVIQNGIVTVGISPYLQVVTVGAILLISMVLEVKRRYHLNLERI